MFPAVVQAKDAAEVLLHFIDGAGAHGAACLPLFVGEVDREAVRVLIAHTGLGEGCIGPVPKTRHVPREHVIAAFAAGDPLGRHQAHAT